MTDFGLLWRRRMRRSGWLVLTLMLLAGRTAAGPVADISAVGKDPDAGRSALKGELEIFPLSAEYLVVAGLYDDFFNRELFRSHKTRLTMADRLFGTGALPKWSYRFFYNFATAESMSAYLPQIRDNFQNPGYFKITVNGEPVAIERLGYWINAVGVKRMPYLAKSGTELTNSAELVPFAYLKLARPLVNGGKVEIVTANGEKAEFVYDDVKTVSRAIKVNQVGYAPEAGQKYAYFGMWLGGELGPLPAAALAGRDFHLRREGGDEIVFTGKIAPRSKLQSIKRDGKDVLLDGEEVMELDFSPFKTEGRFYVQIPGVGRSWGFTVGPDAVGRAFYVQMRGLFHQRSGMAKEAAYTGWPMGADHQFSYRGGFVPNDRHYKGKGSLFTDAKGKTVDLRHFDVVKATATKEILPGLRGGWWDAGDFDRRTYHFETVDALLSVYLLFPDHFRDGQLDLPESGNGVPDIVDEAAWGVEVWRRAQNPAGGVGCWLEATSHPENPDPVEDIQPYYLAIPTRESTIQYCAYAAKLARALQQSGDGKRAKLYFDSARAAWKYALDPSNRAKTSFTMPKVGQVNYAEPEELPAEDLFKAALNMYLFAGEEEYARALDRINFDPVLNRVREAKSAYFLSELVERRIPYRKEIAKYRQLVVKRADELLKSQQELAYRNINWPLGSPYFLFLGWGAGLPFQKGSYLIMAWYLEQNVRYRDGALLCFDWMMGANPMGRSMTTGLGKVYPVRILSLPMWAWRDRLVDPIPGITPYTFSGTNHYSSANMIYSYNLEPRPDHKFAGCNINLLPASLAGREPLSREDCYKIVQRTIPVWRRFANVEGSAVNQNEFTVWETMAPAAAAYGALLSPGWMPPPDWKKQQPEPNIRKIPGYIFLP